MKATAGLEPATFLPISCSPFRHLRYVESKDALSLELRCQDSELDWHVIIR